MIKVYDEEKNTILPDADIEEIIFEDDIKPILGSEDSESLAEIEEDTKAVMSENSLSYYMQRIAGSTPLSKGEEQELGEKIKAGDKEAFEKLVNANLKFVVTVAYKFRNSGLPMSDIINQGNLGLLEAAKRYDPEKGVKFISYAVWWIRQYIVQGIAEQSGTVRLPIKQAGNLFRINAAREKMSHAEGREPTDRELADHLKMKEEYVTNIMRVSKQSLSLEASPKNGEARSFVDFLKSPNEGVEESFLRENLKKVLHEMIDELDAREIKIINLRFGFEEDVHTLDELGTILGVSRERVRQLETRAIEKLRKKAVKKGLQEFLAS